MTGVKQNNNTTLPPADIEKMLDVARFLDGLSGPAALVGPDGQTVDLPEEAFNVLKNVVDAMRLGKAITVAPVDQLLTTQEAADFLGISRPTLVKKLESGDISFEKPSGTRHRKVRLVDIIEYRENQRTERMAALDRLTREAVAQGLYDSRAEDYKQALREARKGLKRD